MKSRSFSDSCYYGWARKDILCGYRYLAEFVERVQECSLFQAPTPILLLGCRLSEWEAIDIKVNREGLRSNGCFDLCPDTTEFCICPRFEPLQMFWIERSPCFSSEHELVSRVVLRRGVCPKPDASIGTSHSERGDGAQCLIPMPNGINHATSCAVAVSQVGENLALSSLRLCKQTLVLSGPTNAKRLLLEHWRLPFPATPWIVRIQELDPIPRVGCEVVEF